MICSASIRPLYCVHRIAVLLAPTWAYYEEKISAHHFGIYHPRLRKSRKWVPIHFSYWAIFVCSFVTDFCCDGCELNHVLFCTFLVSHRKQHQWCRCCFLIKNSDSLSVYPTYFSHLARSTSSVCKVGVCFVDTWELKIWTLPPTLGLIGHAIRGGIVFSTDFAFLHHFRKKTLCF